MSLLLSVTFACGVLIAVAHVLNRRFIAPGYDVVANLTAFAVCHSCLDAARALDPCAAVGHGICVLAVARAPNHPRAPALAGPIGNEPSGDAAPDTPLKR